MLDSALIGFPKLFLTLHWRRQDRETAQNLMWIFP